MRVKNYKIWLSIILFFSIGFLFTCSIVSREMMEITGSYFDGMPWLFFRYYMPLLLALVGIGIGILIVRFISDNLDTNFRKPAVYVSAFTIMIGIGAIFFIVSMSIIGSIGWKDYANLLFTVR